MKKELSAFDLLHVIKELQELVSGKIDQIYQPAPDELLIAVHLTGKGKRWLKIVKGKFLFMTAEKGKVPETPSQFCIYLRKRLENGRIMAIEQLGFERIAMVNVGTKEQNYFLFIELFAKGNVILCAEDKVILRPMETQRLKQRTIRAKEQYSIPFTAKSIAACTPEEIIDRINSSERGLVRSLAIDFNLGGITAEELCLRAQLPKEAKNITLEQAQALQYVSRQLFASAPAPQLVYDKDIVIDATPVQLQYYAGKQQQPCESFNAALEQATVSNVAAKEPEHISKLRTRIALQSEQLSLQQKQAEEQQRIGQLIYEQYGKAMGILEALRAARKTQSWQEIKKRSHEYGIVSIDEQHNSIVIEL